MKIEAAVSAVQELSPKVPPADVQGQKRQGSQEPAQQPPPVKANPIQSEAVLKRIKELTDNGAYSVRFEMDDKADRLIISLVDAETGEMIRQIPPEELLQLATKLEELRGNMIDTTS